MFGRLTCNLFNANDVLFSTASLLHLCCISMDRYIAIMDPFHYHTKMTRARTATMLTFAWVASALISHIPIHLGWYTLDDQAIWFAAPLPTSPTISPTPIQRLHPPLSNMSRPVLLAVTSSARLLGIQIELADVTTVTAAVVEHDECIFRVNHIYCLVSSGISFWTPATVMVFAYVKIYREARRQELQIQQLTVTLTAVRVSLRERSSSHVHSHQYRHNNHHQHLHQHPNDRHLSTESQQSAQSQSVTSQLHPNNLLCCVCNRKSSKQGSKSELNTTSTFQNSALKNCSIEIDNTGRTTAGQPVMVLLEEAPKPRSRTSTVVDRRPVPPSETPKHSQRNIRREHKAAKTLGVIMGCFLLCWLPFFTWYIVSTMCGEQLCSTPPPLVDILFWVGYANSALNPLIYASFNRDFRNAFLRLLHCYAGAQLLAPDSDERRCQVNSRKPRNSNVIPTSRRTKPSTPTAIRSRTLCCCLPWHWRHRFERTGEKGIRRLEQLEMAEDTPLHDMAGSSTSTVPRASLCSDYRVPPTSTTTSSPRSSYDVTPKRTKRDSLAPYIGLL